MNGLLLNLLLVSEMLFTYHDSYFGLDYLPTYVHIVYLLNITFLRRTVT